MQLTLILGVFLMKPGDIIDVPFTIVKDSWTKATDHLRDGLPGGRNRLKLPVKRKAGAINGRLRDFGLSDRLISKAMRGNLGACKLIGEKGRQGDLAKHFAPKVADRVVAAIEGTVAINEAWKDIYQATGKGANALDRAVNTTELNELNYVQNNKEIDFTFEAKKKTHALRSQLADQYLAFQAWMGKEITEVNGNYKLLTAELELEKKQLQLDRDHNKATVEHYLEEGANARDDLRPKKQYGTSKIQQISDAIFGF